MKENIVFQFVNSVHIWFSGVIFSRQSYLVQLYHKK